MNLFGRTISLTIGVPNDPNAVAVSFDDKDATGLDVSGLDIEFHIERSLKPEPNTCQIAVYNLSQKSRAKLEGAKKLSVKLEAGYQGTTSLLYLGEARAAWSIRNEADIVTHIESGDKEDEIQAARLNIPQGAKVPAITALSAIADALGVGQGNIPQAAQLLQEQGIIAVNGGALTGSAARRMTDFCRSAGLEWSIQNGVIQILKIGFGLAPQAFVLSSNNGLIGSPTVDSKGVVSASTLLIPGIEPGCLVDFQALYINGFYRVERCKYYGQTFGQDWTIDLSAMKYSNQAVAYSAGF